MGERVESPRTACCTQASRARGEGAGKGAGRGRGRTNGRAARTCTPATLSHLPTSFQPPRCARRPRSFSRPAAARPSGGARSLTRRGADPRRPRRGEQGGQQHATGGQHVPLDGRPRRGGRQGSAGSGARGGRQPHGLRSELAPRGPGLRNALGRAASGPTRCQCDFPLAHDSEQRTVLETAQEDI